MHENNSGFSFFFFCELDSGAVGGDRSLVWVCGCPKLRNRAFGPRARFKFRRGGGSSFAWVGQSQTASIRTELRWHPKWYVTTSAHHKQVVCAALVDCARSGSAGHSPKRCHDRRCGRLTRWAMAGPSVGDLRFKWLSRPWWKRRDGGKMFGVVGSSRTRTWLGLVWVVGGC